MPLGFPVSYSFLNDEANCPYKAYRRYVVKDLPRGEKTEAQQYGIDAHKALEDRIAQGKALTDRFAQYEPIASKIAGCRLPGLVEVCAERVLTLDAEERPFKASWHHDAFIYTRLDITVTARGTHQAQIFDWKTGKVREDPFELELQAWVLQKYYPGLEIINGNYVWLKDGRLGETHDLSDTERTARSVRRQLNEIESRGDWPKRPNPLCGWCDVKDCEYNRGQK